jgi:hypothetical protein
MTSASGEECERRCGLSVIHRDETANGVESQIPKSKKPKKLFFKNLEFGAYLGFGF